MKKIILNILILICFCSSCFFAHKIYDYIKDEKEQNELLKGIMNESIKKIEYNINQKNNVKNNINLPLEVDFNALKSKNTDIIGWIYSEGTPINYPIVQAKDNDYYLRRLIDGQYNQAGTIFMDYRNCSDFSDFNTIIYGHNMKNDTMFGTLTNYEKQEYYEQHKEMFLYTENTAIKIELFAGFTTASESEIYKYPKTVATNEELIKTAIKNSTFKSNIIPSKEDKIITLSTCSYYFENARYVLLGVVTGIEDF